MAIIEELLEQYHSDLIINPAVVLKPAQTLKDIFRPGDGAYQVGQTNGYFIAENPIDITTIQYDTEDISLIPRSPAIATSFYTFVETQFRRLESLGVELAPLIKYLLCTAHQGALFSFAGLLFAKLTQLYGIVLAPAGRRRCFFNTTNPYAIEVTEYCTFTRFQQMNFSGPSQEYELPTFQILIKFFIVLTLPNNIQIQDFNIYYSSNPITACEQQLYNFLKRTIFKNVPGAVVHQMPFTVEQCAALEGNIRASIQRLIDPALAATPPRRQMHKPADISSSPLRFFPNHFE